jgi:pimeloyl-ACP methyl ester carboxylesterase
MRRIAIGAIIAVLVAAEIWLFTLLEPFLLRMALDTVNELPSSGGPPIGVATADFGGTGPGTLVTATTMPGVTRTVQGRGFNAARVLYRSTSGDTGAETVVSGSVYTPRGKPPAGGWPVAAWGHGTLGIDNACGPSLFPDLLSGVTMVRALVKLGYAVAFTDYQGLGTKGVHPYLDSKTAGLNMIDAVRALRRTFPDVSDRWAAIGGSQGGGAAWAADEQAAGYAPELHLVGAVTSSPGADVTGLVDKAQEGTLTPEQRAVMQAVIESVARLHPDINRDDFRKGAAAEYWYLLSDCSTDGRYARAEGVSHLGPRDFAARTPQAAARLREILQQWALPQRPLSAPLFVWYGGKDPFIDTDWIKNAIQRACGMGGSVTIDFDPNGGHNPADAMKLLDWMGDRFQGKPAKNDC